MTPLTATTGAAVGTQAAETQRLTDGSGAVT